MDSKTSIELLPHRRRNFLKKLSAGMGLAIVYPTLGDSLTRKTSVPLPTPEQPDESYWELVKQQFAVPKNKLMVNSANLCPSPHFVNEKVSELSNDLAKDVSFQNRAKFNDSRKIGIKMLADYLGADSEEIGITRNTSESNNIVVNGFDFKKGDEVIVWDQNHPSANLAWQQKALRQGFNVKIVTVPTSPQNNNELLESFANAISSRTKLMAFSHISNVTGIALPVKEICSLARKNGILTLVDGAQAFGFLDLNLRDIGCDFYSGSTHKWLMGPIENGILYVRNEKLSSIWPDLVTAGWTEEHQTVDEKLCILGQRNYATIASLIDIINFHQTIGKKNIESRVRELNQYLKTRIKEKLPQATFVTPLSSELSGGIVILNLPNKDPREVFQQLYERYGIASAPTGGIRLSPNIHSTLRDMDRIAEALVALS